MLKTGANSESLKLTKPNVIVDTSIWIVFFKDPSSKEKQEIDLLIDEDRVFIVGIILAELLQGTKSQKELHLLRSKLEVLTFLETTQNTWTKAGMLSHSLRRKGITVPLSDCLISASALEHQCHIFSSDPHFRKIPEIKLYEPS